jgi:hypothetical protein
VGVEFKNQDGTLRATDQVLLDLAERFKAMPDQWRTPNRKGPTRAVLPPGKAPSSRMR